MSLVMQGKLLRVLEDQHVQRLGGHTSIHADRAYHSHELELTDLTHDSSVRASESDLSKPLKQWLVEKEEAIYRAKIERSRRQ